MKPTLVEGKPVIYACPKCGFRLSTPFSFAVESLDGEREAFEFCPRCLVRYAKEWGIPKMEEQ